MESNVITFQFYFYIKVKWQFLKLILRSYCENYKLISVVWS